MPTLNREKVAAKNDENMRGAMDPGEVADLEAAIAADGEDLVEFLASMEKGASAALTAKRRQILQERNPTTRKALMDEARALIFKKVGAQAYLKAME
jgi:hypothetical protein